MFDTMKTAMLYDYINITDEALSHFSANPNYLRAGQSAYLQQTAEEKQQKIYLPQVQVSCIVQPGKKAYKELRVEFSAPKLLYGNNLVELSEDDFPKLVDKLAEKLALMGILVDKSIIESSTVVKLHSGKNIDLTGKISCMTLTSVLQTIPVPKNLDTSYTKFKNGGEAYMIHTSDYELSVYDKLCELQKSGSKVLENVDGMVKEVDLSESIINKGIKRIVRYEYRLNTKEAIKKVFAAAKIESDLTLKDVFKADIARRMNLYAWDKYIAPHMVYAKIARVKILTLIDVAIEKDIPRGRLSDIIMVRYLSGHGGMQKLKDRYPNFNIEVKRIQEYIEKMGLKEQGVGKTLRYIRKTLDENVPFSMGAY